MGLSCGIVGLPNAGKSTLFNALTQAGAAVAPYPFCTIEPKEGTVPVADGRLAWLAEHLNPPQVTPATLTFVDIAGLVKGAHDGEGLGNRFLSHIREVDAVVHVIRLFEDGKVSHVSGHLNPLEDLEVVLTELMLADLDTVQRRKEKTEKMAKVGDKDARRSLDLLHRLEATLQGGIPASHVKPRDPKEEVLLRELFLLTAKPAMLVANIGEDQVGREAELLAPLAQQLSGLGIPAVAVCARLESDLAELPEADRGAFMSDLGLDKLALEKVVELAYRRLNLITFYTTVGKELRAWTLQRGTAAAVAAGKIHTDMEKGFIKAEVLPFADFQKAGSEHLARSHGWIRAEGRDYVVNDGDIVYFHFRS